MADIKKTVLQKKIGDTVYDIHTQTSADIVMYQDSTVAATLGQMAEDIASVTADAGLIDEKIEAATTGVYNQIMGITEEDGATVKEAYDTLKEVAAYIDDHGEVAAGFATNISALQTAVGDEDSGLVKDVDDLQTTVGGSTSGLVKDVDDLQTAVGDEASGLVKDVDDLQTTVGGSTSGLVKDVADLQTTIAVKGTVDVVTEVPATATEHDLFLKLL